MAKEETYLKNQIKISLPIYMVLLAFLFAICLPFIRTASFYNEIGVAIDSYFAILSVIIFSNTYFYEVQNHTSENFYLIPGKTIQIELLKRIIIKSVFLIILAIITFGFYLCNRLGVNVGESRFTIFINAMFAISSSVIFWGILSNFVVCLTSNLVIGVSVVTILWFQMNSSFAQKLPVFLNIFAYGAVDSQGNEIVGWQISKIFYLLLSFILLYWSSILAKRSPCK